jgi:hypothetical protein
MSGFTDVFKNPDVQSSLVEGGLKMVGGAMAGQAAQKKTEWEAAEERKALARQRMFDAQRQATTQENTDFANRQSQGTQADETVLGAMGKSPLAFQRERMKMDAIANTLESGGPSNLSGHMPKWMKAQKVNFRPSAEAEAPYWAAVANAGRGRFQGANLGGVYGNAGRDVDTRMGGISQVAGDRDLNEWQAHQSKVDAQQKEAMAMATQDYNKESGLDANGRPIQQQKKKGGIWSKILKGAGIASAFIPGVNAFSPLIMAGTNALAHKLDGGSWGGALGQAGMGLALGQVTGALGGRLPGAATGGTPPIMNLAAQAPSTFTNQSMMFGNPSFIDPTRGFAG